MSELLTTTNPLIKIQNCYFNPNSNVEYRNILISVAVHGDEQCGMHAVNELLTSGIFRDLSKFNWKQVVFVIGNPKAVEAKKRFINVNLNRIFSHQLHSNVDSSGYEYGLVSDLKQLINECDVLLDVHSTSALSEPFAIPTPALESIQFAETFPVKYVVEGLIKTIRGTTIEYAHEMGKNALCIECGIHDGIQSLENAKAVISRLIYGKKTSTRPVVLSCSSSQLLRPGFRFVFPVTAFKKVDYGQVIAIDEEGEIKCPFYTGSYLIMPTANPIPGEEAWYWGVERKLLVH
jgi:hypothetical protein